MPLFALAFPYLLAATLVASIIGIFIRRKLAVLMLICTLAGFYNITQIIAFNLPSKFITEKNNAALRIMTWNVQDFVDLTAKTSTSQKMLQLIAAQNPNIICMQELTNVEGGKRRISIRQKMDSMGYKYYFFSMDEHITNKAGTSVITRGCAIFSKQPFIDSNRIFINRDELNVDEHLIYVDIHFNNQPLRIFTAHLASFALFKDTATLPNKDIYEITYNRKSTIQYKLRDVERIHSKEASIIRNEISQAKKPVIYCGDMNTVATSYTYHFLKGGLQDAFLEKGCGIGATFYKIIPTLRIDYVFADKHLKVEQCKVIKKKLSDHYPVVTDVTWK